MTFTTRGIAPLAFVFAFAFFAAHASPAERARAQHAGPTVNGNWELAISEADARSRIDRGIAAATEALPPLVNGIAADRLRERTPTIRRVHIATTPARIVVHLDERRYESAPGARQHVRSTAGEQVRMVQHFRDGNLEQTFQAEGGTRWNTFVLADGGQAMTLHAVVQSERLPSAVRFSLPYRRAR